MTVGILADEETVRSAVATVDDPEYPGISIVDLGLLESVAVESSRVYIGLIPTFSGCPALDVIRTDVARAVSLLDGVEHVDVVFLARPVWTPERISSTATIALRDHFTVAVEIGGRKVRCPRCGGQTTEVAAFGPTRCRSVSRCEVCGEVVEVVR